MAAGARSGRGSVAHSDTGGLVPRTAGGGTTGAGSVSGGRRQGGGSPSGVPPMRSSMFWAWAMPCSAAAANMWAASASLRWMPRALVSIQPRLYWASASP
jgi:hypothetical protein